MATASTKKKSINIKFHDIKPDEIYVEKTQDSLLGSGGFGSVYKGTLRKGCLDVAVKYLKRDDVPEGGLSVKCEKILLKEARNMYAAQHPSVIAIYGCLMSPDTRDYALVMEYMHHGSLDDLMLKVTVPWTVRLEMILSISQGLGWLHSKMGIAHGDIKICNILVNRRFHAKLGDFGLAKLQRITSSSARQTGYGTITHTAPEIFLDCLILPNEKTDMWSFGVTVYQIATNANPDALWNGGHINDKVLINAVSEQKKSPIQLDKIDPSCPEFLTSIMQKCVAWDPTDRPTFLDFSGYVQGMYNTHYSKDFDSDIAQLFVSLGCSTADAAECMETDVVEGVESSDFTDSPPQSSERMEDSASENFSEKSSRMPVQETEAEAQYRFMSQRVIALEDQVNHFNPFSPNAKEATKKYTQEIETLRLQQRMAEVENRLGQTERQQLMARMDALEAKLASQAATNTSTKQYGPLQSNLHCNRVQILQDMQPHALYAYFIQEDILTTDEVERIRSKGIRRDQAEELIGTLLLKPESAMKILIHALRENGQSHLADKIVGQTTVAAH